MGMLGKMLKNYIEIRGWRLTNRVRLIKLPKDKDVSDLGGIQGLERIKLL